MASPLAGSLAKTIHKAMANTFLDATLVRSAASGPPDPFNPPTVVEVYYPCKAIRDSYGVGHRQGGLVDAEDVKIIVLQRSLSVSPQPGDRITIAGQGGPFTVVPVGAGQPAVSADPANATWELRAKA